MPPKLDDIVNGKYRVVRQLGEGGMGSVFEAIHERLGTRVALEFLHHELAHRDEVMQRFVQEARLVASVKSPHVVQVNDVEQTPDGALFMVLEYLEGRTLQRVHHDLHAEGRRLTQEESMSLALQILEGARAAHAVGIVHRDLKPDNVMIVAGAHGEPFVKLLDFGIAKLRAPLREPTSGMTRPGIVMGTPEYMAPEQAFSADAVDARADVFAIGVMAFEMFAGCRPVGGDDPQILAAMHLAGDVARLDALAPELPRGLADVVHKAMAARAPERYASAAAFLAALEPFADAMFGPVPSRRAQPEALVGQELGVAPGVSAAASSEGATRVVARFGTAVMPQGPLPPGVADAAGSFDSGIGVGPTPVSGLDPRRMSAQEPVPTTRPAQAVMVDSTRNEATRVLSTSEAPWSDDDASAVTAFAPRVSEAAPEPPAEVSAHDGLPVQIAHEITSRKAIARAATPRRGLWIGLFIALGVAAAIGVGLYVAHPSFLDDDAPTRRRPHPGPTTKKPAPAPTKKH